MKKATRKLLVWTMIAALLLAVMTGCAASKSTPAQDEETSDQTESNGIVLNYTWWGNQVRGERTTKVTEMYTQLHPDITFALEFTDGGSYADLITTRAAAKNMPNIIQADWDKVPEYVDKDLIVPLDDFVSSGVLDTADCDPNTIETGTVDGKLYAMSMGNNARAMFYDATLLESLDLSISMEPTWEEFKELGKTIYEKTGVQTSFCWQISFSELMRNVIRGQGYEFYNEDKSALGFDDPAVAEKAFALLEEVGQQEWVVDPAEYAGITGSELEPIVSGKAWNAFITSNMGVGLQTACGDARNLGICVTPNFADAVRQPAYTQPSQLTCVGNVGTQADKEAAAAFLSYIINDVDANKVLLNERGVSMNSKVCEAIAGDLDDISTKIAEYVTYVAEHGSPAPMLEPACSSQIFDMEKDLRIAVLFGSMSAKDAAEQFFTQANSILAENAK